MVVLAIGGCSLQFGAPESASEEGDRILSLWQLLFVAGLAVGGLVWALLIFVLLRYRHRDGDDDELPSQSAYNIPVEVLYTATPVLLVAALFSFSVFTERQVTRLDDDPDVHVEVVGFQWSWQFRYLDTEGAEEVLITGSAEEPPELVLPLGEVTQLDLDSRDVAHSFWVPDFLSKRDLIPGVDNSIQVTPTELGSYDGRCAEFCGIDHWRMYFTVRVVAPDEYQAWLDAQRTDASSQEAGQE